uniref:Uncharacterized protein n=1 Tax=viral metagenome TaxID=1070528 RepID=A0A6H1Z7S5_9ZZZZ
MPIKLEDELEMLKRLYRHIMAAKEQARLIASSSEAEDTKTAMEWSVQESLASAAERVASLIYQRDPATEQLRKELGRE